MTCNTCHWWEAFTTLLSEDGKEFQIGHCAQARGLTADEHWCCEYVDDRSIAVPMPSRDGGTGRETPEAPNDQ